MTIENCTVIYEGCIVEVSAEFITDGLEYLSTMDRNERKAALKAVDKSLEKLLPKIMNGSITPVERHNFCDDVGIWFVEQVRTGKHEQYQQAKH